jgi:decaprenylphospho-beta-D-erythro-pentofuranosid-2-ulose 2-reductase
VNAILFGATKGMGRAVARELAQRGDRLFLIGRDVEDLARTASDLDIRRGHPAVAGTARCDLDDPATFPSALATAKLALGDIDLVVVSAGEFATQLVLEAEPDRARQLLAANFTNTIVFCEEARGYLLPRGGTLCVFSSVAGDRGRKPVILYGAAKAGLSRYLEGLDHKFRRAGLKVVCVRPGFVKTSMTEGLKPPPFAGTPDKVAKAVVRAIDRGTPVIYAPPVWRLVMMVIRMLPRAVMRRVDF